MTPPLAPRGLRRAFALLLTLAAPFASAADDLAWPEITNQTKPWSRWWWLGSIGTKAEFTSEMEKYARAGLGGLEITPIYSVRGQEDRARSYLTPQWMELFDHVLDEGQRLGLGLDMATGNGWPFGGPWVAPRDAARHAVTKTYELKGGGRLGEKVTATETPFVRYQGPRRTPLEQLKDPVVSNPNLQELALDQVRFPRALPLQALVAHSATGEKIQLTDKVGADGQLDWTAAAGDWTLYAVFLGWHGKQVERAGPGGEGDVIDHFSREALQRYLQKFDEAYAGHRANRLRGYFNDSYEVDDANGESNWTPRFFAEFQRRRGYDLRDELPAYFGKDTPDKNARVISDHRETISDLLLEEFTQPWAAWAAKHGALVRNQAHGSPANIIDLYAASGIPETEGTNIIGMKLASSAAHVTGKPLTAAETATWLDEHFVSTLDDIKRRVDLMFLGGVNHNCYHGTAFSPPGDTWPGHHFYAAVELNPSNPIWADSEALNRYVARCQSFLQGGKPAHDILLYYPIHDAWAVRGNGAMPHFGGGARAGGQGIAQELQSRGFTFDFITDRLLAGVQSRDGKLVTGGVNYAVVVVPETKLMPLATLEHLFRLAEAGATIVLHKALPQDVPGLGKLLARRSEFQVHGEAFKRATRDESGIATLAWNRGRLLLGDDLEKLLAKAGVKRETLVDTKLEFVRRAHDKGHAYFLANRTEAAIAGWIPLATPASEAALFDPMTGRSGIAARRLNADGRSEVYVQLEPGETCVVKTFASGRHEGAAAFSYLPARAPAGSAVTGWSVSFTSGGPTLPAKVAALPELRSWTEFGGDELKAFSGTAVYAAKFTAPRDRHVLLDLGKVADSARVKINGREIAVLIGAPWRVVVPRDALRDGENTLEIAVSNLAANRIADLDRRDAGWKKFYNTNFPARIAANRGADGNFSAANWTPRSSGLLGPVTVAPFEWQVPAR